MANLPKIKFEDLTRTNLGFPSEWKNKQQKLKISYRRGKVTIHIDDVLVLNTTKHWDDFDIGGYLDDSELIEILKHHNLLDENE